MGNESRTRSQSRVSKDSAFFEKAVPVLLVLMGLLTIILIGFAAGLLLGFIHL